MSAFGYRQIGIDSPSSTAEIAARVIERFVGDTGTWRPRPTIKLATKNAAIVVGKEMSKSNESLVGFMSAHSPARSLSSKDQKLCRGQAKSHPHPSVSREQARRACDGFVGEEWLGAWRI